MRRALVLQQASCRLWPRGEWGELARGRAWAPRRGWGWFTRVWWGELRPAATMERLAAVLVVMFATHSAGFVRDGLDLCRVARPPSHVPVSFFVAKKVVARCNLLYFLVGKTNVSWRQKQSQKKRERPLRGLNPRPPDSKSGALSTELKGRA